MDKLDITGIIRNLKIIELECKLLGVDYRLYDKGNGRWYVFLYGALSGIMPNSIEKYCRPIHRDKHMDVMNVEVLP